MPDAARRAAGMNDALLLYVPAARSPLKQSRPGASDADRVAMLQIALRGLPDSAIWTDEIDRSTETGEPSFTVETLRRLRSVLPPDIALRLLIGADQAAEFHRWREPDEILSVAPVIVMLRGGDRPGLLSTLARTGRWTAQDLERWDRAVAEIPLMDVSATRIRDLLARAPNPHDERKLKAMLDPDVLAFISRNGLYRQPGA